MKNVPSFSIRRASCDDMDALTHIYDEALEKTSPNVLERYQANKKTIADHFAYDMRSLMRDPQKHIDMACIEGVPQAFVVYDIPEDEPLASAELLYNASSVYSLGAILLDHVKSVARENGKEGLLLDGVVPDAFNVYAAMGFKQAAGLRSAKHMVCRVNENINVKHDHPARIKGVS